MELKQRMKRNPDENSLRMELDKQRQLFQSNILAFEQMQFGLEPELNETADGLKDCLEHIQKNAEGSESRPP